MTFGLFGRPLGPKWANSIGMQDRFLAGSKIKNARKTFFDLIGFLHTLVQFLIPACSSYITF